MARARYNPSSDRQQLSRLLGELKKIFDTFAEPLPALRASLQKIRRRCGKPGCRCESGALHESLVLVDRSNGDRKTRKVRRAEQLQLRKLTRRYRDLRRGRARVSEIHAEFLRCCDRLYQWRLREGQKMLD